MMLIELNSKYNFRTHSLTTTRKMTCHRLKKQLTQKIGINLNQSQKLTSPLLKQMTLTLLVANRMKSKVKRKKKEKRKRMLKLMKFRIVKVWLPP